MIDYKILETEHELKQVEELCGKYGLNAASSGFTLIAVEGNTVIGAITLKNVAMIEPMVSDNPIVANNLAKMIEGVILSKQIKVVRCFVEEKNEKVFTKGGYNKVFDGNIILEKIY